MAVMPGTAPWQSQRPTTGGETMEPLTQVPLIPWGTLQARLARDWKPGQHVTLVGPTGSGKTHMAVALLDMCKYRLILATKRQDPLVSSLHRHGYIITNRLDDIQWAPEAKEPIQKKIVYWPQFGEKKTQRQRQDEQGKLMAKALDWAEKTGGGAVLVDETIWMHKHLGLERELSSLWFQGRTMGGSVIAGAHPPSHVPRPAWAQADY